VAKSQAEGLQMFLGSVVEGLLRWQDDTKNHFKAKVLTTQTLLNLSLLWP
jgi:ribosomal RNA-processing protein 12